MTLAFCWDDSRIMGSCGWAWCETIGLVLRCWSFEMNDWLRLAVQRTVVKRALKFAFVVGIILITINHGHAIVHGQVTSGRVWQMGLTVLVPYVVSTLSSVGATREMARREQVGERSA
jgi:hypothetical protein